MRNSMRLCVAIAVAACASTGCYGVSYRDCAVTCVAGGCPDGAACDGDGFCRIPGASVSCRTILGDANAGPGDSPGDPIDVFTPAGAGRIGSTGPVTRELVSSANLLAVGSLTVPEDHTLIGFGMVSKQAGGRARLALYRDLGGVLIAATDPFTLVPGEQQIDVSPIPLTTGLYVLGAVFEQDTTIGATGVFAQYFGRAHAFADDLPATFEFTDQLFLNAEPSYWIVVQSP